MPRNSQGLYTLPAGNPVVPNTLIEAAWANSTMDDIAVALTASLPRDGSAPMTGDLTLAAGNPQTSRSAVSRAYVDSFLSYATGMPVGAILSYAGGVAPPGYLLCDGAAVSRTTYAALFAAVGTIYGAGDNATTFNVPDLRNQFIRGLDSTIRALGSTQAGSFAAHTHPVSDPGHTHGASQASHSHSITTGSHGHTINDPGHSHSQTVSATPGSGFAYGTGNVANGTTGASGTGISINNAGNLGGSSDAQTPNVTVAAATTGETIGSTGGTETVPQNIALAYYIKAEVDVAGGNTVVAIQSSDTNMIAIDETNPAIPVLDIKSNVAFGVVKLDSAGQIPVNLLPTTGVTYQGQLDASSGNLPVGTFFTGDFYNIAVGGTLSLYTSSGGPVPKVVVIGDQIIYDETISGWWYNAASAIASIAAAAVTFVPHGTIAATNAQAAIEELDNETQTALSGKASSSASTAVGTSFTPIGTIAATDVQTAIAELDVETQNALSGKAPTSAGTAVGTSFTPSGNIAASNVQAAIQELDSETQTSLSGKAPLAASTANGTSFTPSGTVGATNVQAAIQELDTEKMPIAGGTFSGQVAVQVPGIPAAPVRLDQFPTVTGGNGSLSLPGGLQIRWGSGNAAGAPNVAIDFADFANGCNSFVCSGDLNNPVVENFGARSRFSTQIISGGGGNVWGYSWIAIGN